MVLFWCLVQLGANAAYAAITAAVPDRVPVLQRGGVGGLAAMGQTVGILIGAVFGAVVSGNFMVGYALCAAALLVSVVPYLFHRNDPPLPQGAGRRSGWASFLRGFWISPARHPDFAWAWLTRFLVNVCNQMTIVYLLFFLRDVLKHEDPALGVLTLTGIYAVMVMITAVMAGPWSDRLGRRKPFVIGSSAIIAVAGLTMAFFPVWTGALVGAGILGVGFGAYLAVDFALLTQVLPQAADRGKDMGIINVANSLPQVFAPGARLPRRDVLRRVPHAVHHGRRHRPARRRLRRQNQGRGLMTPRSACRIVEADCRRHGMGTPLLLHHKNTTPEC